MKKITLISLISISSILLIGCQKRQDVVLRSQSSIEGEQPIGPDTGEESVENQFRAVPSPAQSVACSGFPSIEQASLLRLEAVQIPNSCPQGMCVMSLICSGESCNTTSDLTQALVDASAVTVFSDCYDPNSGEFGGQQ